MQDLKIRVSYDPVMRGMVSDLGAVPVSIPFTELYSALNVGVVDGSEQPVSNYYSNAFHEVAPCIILDGHTLGAVQIVISDKGWVKLNAQQQEWVREAAQYASVVCREKLSEQELVVFQNLRNNGATIGEMTDKAPWRAACQPVIQANTGNLTEVYQQILAME